MKVDENNFVRMALVAIILAKAMKKEVEQGLFSKSFYFADANSKIINSAVSSPIFSTDIKSPDSQKTSPTE